MEPARPEALGGYQVSGVRCQVSGMRCQLSVASSQLPVPSGQLPVASCRYKLSAIRCQLSVLSFQFPVVSARRRWGAAVAASRPPVPRRCWPAAALKRGEHQAKLENGRSDSRGEFGLCDPRTGGSPPAHRCA